MDPIHRHPIPKIIHIIICIITNRHLIHPQVGLVASRWLLGYTQSQIDTNQIRVIIHSKEADGSPHCYSKAVYNLGEPLKIEEWTIQQSGDTKHLVDMVVALQSIWLSTMTHNHPGASLRSIAHSDLSQTNGISCEGIIRRKAGGTGFIFQIKASGQKSIQYDVIVYGSSRNLSMPTLHQADLMWFRK